MMKEFDKSLRNNSGYQSVKILCLWNDFHSTVELSIVSLWNYESANLEDYLCKSCQNFKII